MCMLSGSVYLKQQSRLRLVSGICDFRNENCSLVVILFFDFASSRLQMENG
jgi:hypothetical protein